jgi:transposase
MKFVGIDLHKKSISLCVVDQQRQVLARKKFLCDAPDQIEAYFRGLGPFQAAVEATSSYEGVFQRLEPLAARLVLVHAKKMRIIAESTRKSDRVDAQVLAEFLALDMLPQAYCPTPRQREHRQLVRQRCYVQKRITAVRCKIRWIAARYNADRADLFTPRGQAHLAALPLSKADRFVVEQLLQEWRMYVEQREALEAELHRFAQSAPQAEKQARAILKSIPYVGTVTIDAVLSEVGDVQRLRSQKRAASFAGLAPGQRESGGQRREQGISKAGSPVLRWAVGQAAWRLVAHVPRWQRVFEALAQRRGKKRAIVAIARRLWCVMVAMLQSGRRYNAALR